jgi:hypothetical protein
MQSIPVSPRVGHAEGVSGVPWERLVRLKHGVCWRWYRRLAGCIPLQACPSEAHEGLAWALLHFDPTQGAQFSTLLSNVLRRPMGEVPRKAWGALVRRSADAQGRAIAGATQYPAPDPFPPLTPARAAREAGARLVPVPRPLTQPATPEACVLVQACLGCLRTRTNATTRPCFLPTVEGDEADACRHRSGTTTAAIYQRVRPLRPQRKTWAAA